MNITIIGGGLSGIFAAKTLVEKGDTPIIIEKSKSVGGRMATRRIDEGHADHGAQFFTVRSPELQNLTEEWLENQWIKHWFGKDYPRYTGVNGMTPFVKKLAQDLPVHLEEHVDRIDIIEKGLTLSTNIGKEYASDAVIVTAPVPQSLELLQKSHIPLSNQDNVALIESNFRPCFVGLFSLNKPVSVGEHGIISEHLPRGVDKIVANDQKGISTPPILSVYMNGEWSADHFEQKDEEVVAQILTTISPHVIQTDNVATSQVKRWRYAEATHVYRRPFLKLDDYPIFIAGDSFLTKGDTSGRTRVESAILSGIRVGEAVHQRGSF